MRKKISVMILCLCLSGAVVGCGGAGSYGESVAANAPMGTSEENVQPTPEPLPEPTPEPTSRPAPEPAVPYVEENNLAFSQETSLTLQGLRVRSENPSDYEFIDTEWKIVDVTIEDAEEEGFQIITVETAASGCVVDTLDHHVSRTLMLVPKQDFCDMYTGRVLPGANLVDGLWTAEIQGTELEWEGSSYTIGYTTGFQSAHGEWEPGNNGMYYCLTTYNLTDIIRVTEGYDGLVLKISSMTEFGGELEAGIQGEGEEAYIMDGDWDDSTHLYRVSELYEIFHPAQ